MTLLLWLGIACGEQTCDEMTGLDADACRHEEIRASSDAAVVLQTAQAIDDPIVRGTAVTEWVSAHKNEVQQADGLALCDLLEHPEKGVCRRRLQAAHLQ